VRKVVVMMSVSLDGYMEGPGHDLSWHLVDDELHAHFNEVLRAAGAFLEGRVTHELMAGYWPTADSDPTAPAPVKEFAAIWRDMPKVVYSRTLAAVDGNASLSRELVPEQVQALKDQPGGDLYVGGADLADTFRRHGLVDEYRVYVHPVVLGEGTPLFRPAEATVSLRLLETHRFTNGVVLLRYATG
jgi:dihydrofolate reductase